jgi:hypothetical protein
VALDEFRGHQVLERSGVIFVHASEQIRLNSPQGMAVAISVAETKSAGLAVQWLARRSPPSVEGKSTSGVLTGGVTLRQKVLDGSVHVYRAYLAPR